MQTPRTITLKEACARLKCGRDFLRSEIRRHRLRVLRVNARVVLVFEDSIIQYERDRSA
jgi:excisionase family DNA binding protein